MKHILITGSTDGIGRLTAEKLAQEKHVVVLHGRNNGKLERTISDIQQVSENKNVFGVTADLSDFSQLKLIPQFLEDKNLKLDTLINNAGVFKSSVAKNKNGFDLRFMVNYFAPYHLSHLLIPLMKEHDDKRIINLSSAAQESVSIPALKGTTELNEQSAYAQSKLALTMWSFYLGKSLPEFAVIPVNPGSLLNTKMVQEAYGRFWSPANKGADILKDLALGAKYKNLSGKYFDNDLGNPFGDFGPAHQDAYNKNLIEELIDCTEAIVRDYIR